jgi:hypothetical protein
MQSVSPITQVDRLQQMSSIRMHCFLPFLGDYHDGLHDYCAFRLPRSNNIRYVTSLNFGENTENLAYLAATWIGA